jgi:large subunit ribosomal protein L30
MTWWAVVRVRGTVNVDGKISDTLKMLRLNKTNHCVIIPESPTYKGMLQIVKDYVTWGEIQPKVLSELLKARGELEGGKNITDTVVKSHTGFDSINTYSQAILNGETTIKKFEKLKPVFRLSPPKKGYDGIKRAFKTGGALGYRGDKINELLRRMF